MQPVQKGSIISNNDDNQCNNININVNNHHSNNTTSHDRYHFQETEIIDDHPS